jgi:membrane associated rhomboid family serine protease
MFENISPTPVADIIFWLTLITSAYTIMWKQDSILPLSLHPYSISRGSRYYTIITSIFVHADMQHLAFNMFTYYFFAFQLELTFVALQGDMGHLMFFVVYILGAIGGDITTLKKYKNDVRYYSLGASGAISAVLFSYIMFFPLTHLYLLFIPIGIPVLVFGPVYLLYCINAAKDPNSGINHDAHFYGAITGIALTIAMAPNVLVKFISTLSNALYNLIY